MTRKVDVAYSKIHKGNKMEEVLIQERKEPICRREKSRSLLFVFEVVLFIFFKELKIKH